MNRYLKRLSSWLFWVNFFVFQWFFIRLGKTVKPKTGEIISWRIFGFIAPLTGWWNKYIWIWKLNKDLVLMKKMIKEIK